MNHEPVLPAGLIDINDGRIAEDSKERELNNNTNTNILNLYFTLSLRIIRKDIAGI